ncbi:hypothetical protein [Mesorhizobium sp.]|uniref:hypothetical protein n=1 Tax=Mesorhizobium TaxID=68287 RepID=UPI00257C6E93|nr:hypothetical protein [Mesorhizobium sp.]
MRQKLASVISCPNIAFQIGYLKNAVGEGSDGIDNDGHSESTSTQGGFGRHV